MFFAIRISFLLFCMCERDNEMIGNRRKVFCQLSGIAVQDFSGGPVHVGHLKESTEIIQSISIPSMVI